ncbi:putative glycoside hydrolase [Paenibacillus guangzhouensis]|uniref:putative glycoside hydrolase n=1 Tax=Paenibacillus guangzhouensis TaxID=1473112 RepID=UPI0012675A0C|nr:putative glycoside hydrolase [Paenibacillus guangzhouensis]
MPNQFKLLLLFLGLAMMLTSCESSATRHHKFAQSPKTQDGITPSSYTDEQAQQVLARRLPKKIHARGIYVSGWVAGSNKALNRLLGLLERTDLNTLVIDVKADEGILTYSSSIPLVKEAGADHHPAIQDIRALVRRLKAKQIYTIGRIVTFKDPYLAKKKPEWALHKKNGDVWHDVKGTAWLDPYLEKTWDYNIAIAVEAARLGFDEIQFDYVRFPDNARRVNQEVVFTHQQGRTRAEAIRQFLQRARPAIHAAGAYVSADVFGLVTSEKNDMGIGQVWEQIASEVDYISPMTYPSHYSSGTYGIAHPDLTPGSVIKHAMIDAKKRNEQMSSSNTERVIASNTQNRRSGNAPAEIRPWLQNFTATWVRSHRAYGESEVIQQVKALEGQGIHQFLLWNSKCKYNYK